MKVMNTWNVAETNKAIICDDAAAPRLTILSCGLGTQRGIVRLSMPSPSRSPPLEVLVEGSMCIWPHQRDSRSISQHCGSFSESMVVEDADMVQEVLHLVNLALRIHRS